MFMLDTRKFSAFCFVHRPTGVLLRANNTQPAFQPASLCVAVVRSARGAHQNSVPVPVQASQAGSADE